MDIKFDNISKIQYFQTYEDDGRVESVYEGVTDEDRGQDNQNITTTLLLHLKRPASFFLKHKNMKKILSPFSLPQADQRNQLPNFWNMN